MKRITKLTALFGVLPLAVLIVSAYFFPNADPVKLTLIYCGYLVSLLAVLLGGSADISADVAKAKIRAIFGRKG